MRSFLPAQLLTRPAVFLFLYICKFHYELELFRRLQRNMIKITFQLFRWEQKFFFQCTYVLFCGRLKHCCQGCSQLVIFLFAQIQLLFYLACWCLQFFEIESDFVHHFFVGYISVSNFCFCLSSSLHLSVSLLLWYVSNVCSSSLSLFSILTLMASSISLSGYRRKTV